MISITEEQYYAYLNEIKTLRQRNAELLEEIKKLKEAKEINKVYVASQYNSYPDDGFGGYPMQYEYNKR